MRIMRAILAIATVACLFVLLAVPAAAARPHALPGTRPHVDHHRRGVQPRGAQLRVVRPAGTTQSSNPRDLASHGGFIWFDAYNPNHGSALWKSDSFTTTAIYDNV